MINCVHLASTFAGVATIGTVKQWDAKEKSYIDVFLPNMVIHESSVKCSYLAHLILATSKFKKLLP